MKASGQSSEIRVKCCVLVYQRPWKWTNRVGFLSDCPTPHSNLKCPLWNSSKNMMTHFVSLSKTCQFWWLLFHFGGEICSADVLFSLLSPVIALSSYSHAAGWSWEQGQQMFRQGSGRDAGVHADHHVVMSSPRCCHRSFCFSVSICCNSSSVGLLMNPDVFLFHHNSSFS